MVSIHVLAGGTAALDAGRYIGNNAHKQSRLSHQKCACVQQNRACWTFARGCCYCNLWKPRTQYTESMFIPSGKKKNKTKELFYNNNFRKFIIYNSTPDALHDLHTSECKRPYNRTYDGCLGKPAEGKKVRTSKQLRFVSDLLDNKLMHELNYGKSWFEFSLILLSIILLF